MSTCLFFPDNGYILAFLKLSEQKNVKYVHTAFTLDSAPWNASGSQVNFLGGEAMLPPSGTTRSVLGNKNVNVWHALFSGYKTNCPSRGWEKKVYWDKGWEFYLLRFLKKCIFNFLQTGISFHTKDIIVVYSLPARKKKRKGHKTMRVQGTQKKRRVNEHFFFNFKRNT